MKRICITAFIVLMMAIAAQAQLRDDVRLRKEVSLWHKSLPLPELLRNITKQTGVPLRINGWAPPLRLHLFVQRKRAWEVLEGLSKLLTTDGSLSVRWLPKGKGYLLELSRSKDIRKEWERFLRSLLEASPYLAEGKPMVFSFNGIPISLL